MSNTRERRNPRNPSPASPFPDSRLRDLIAYKAAGNVVHIDGPITPERIRRLARLFAFNHGIADLTGLEAAERLAVLFLGSNAVSDLTPLSELPLVLVDVHDNRVSDLSPLVDIDTLETLYVDRNPLSEGVTQRTCAGAHGAGCADRAGDGGATLGSGRWRRQLRHVPLLCGGARGGSRVSAQAVDPDTVAVAVAMAYCG